jgi:hypothetical protein
VKRPALALLVFCGAIVASGCGSQAPVRTTKSHLSQFCDDVKPGVQAEDRFHSILAGVSTHTVAITRDQLLTQVDTMLDLFKTLGPQLRHAPANVRSSFDSDITALGRFKAALNKAVTKSQIEAAAQKLRNSPKELPFIGYILAQCETPTSVGNPSDP